MTLWELDVEIGLERLDLKRPAKAAIYAAPFAECKGLATGGALTHRCQKTQLLALALAMPEAFRPLSFILFGWTELLFDRVSKQPVHME